MAEPAKAVRLAAVPIRVARVLAEQTQPAPTRQALRQPPELQSLATAPQDPLVSLVEAVEPEYRRPQVPEVARGKRARVVQRLPVAARWLVPVAQAMVVLREIPAWQVLQQEPHRSLLS
jgi:hypothetical protein